LPDAAGGADGYGDACGREGLVGVGPAVAGDDGLDSFLSHGLSGLDAGTTRRVHCQVLQHLKGHALRVHDEQERTAPEARVDLRVEGGSGGRHGYLHQGCLPSITRQRLGLVE
jgi:hypothetical protein